MTNFNIYSKDLKSPTKKEFAFAIRIFPDIIPNFGFIYNNGITDFLKGDRSPEQIIKEVELSNWDRAFEHRLNNLKISFIFSVTVYNRGLYENGEDRVNIDKIINERMFNYHTEILYYHLIALRDCTLHILNAFYNCELKEWEVKINKLITKKKILNERIIEELVKLEKDDIGLNKIRNTFAHNFPNNISDNRLKEETNEKYFRYSIENKHNTYYSTGKIYQPKMLMEHINISITHINNFIYKIQKEIILTKS